MDHDQHPFLLHRNHLQSTFRVVVPQDQDTDPGIVVVDDPAHDDRVRQHLPDSSLADLVPASRLSELDAHGLIIVEHNCFVNPDGAVHQGCGRQVFVQRLADNLTRSLVIGPSAALKSGVQIRVQPCLERFGR